MEPSFDTFLGVGDVAFGERDVALLEAIDEYGSLNRAAGELGRSYARVQQRVVELEDAFGPLVERTRGGAGGGGSQLTQDAHDLLVRFERIRVAASGVAQAEETILSGRVMQRDGELATVETDTGPVRALVPPDAERVELSIRSDAVTLTAPGQTPEPTGTSARNRFEGTVERLDPGEAIAHVAIDVGVEDPLVALVTLSSVEKLGLEEDMSVVVTFKATATRGVCVD